jgi:Ca2+/Na+ antiporter
MSRSLVLRVHAKALFAAGVCVSLAASWQLVLRLERLGSAGFSEASLGLAAALAADAPEITSAAIALAHGQASVGAGVADRACWSPPGTRA